MDIGVLGGTFDPIHFGHLSIAEEARKRFSLTKVIFIPTGQPWLKTDREITPTPDRIAMVNLAIGSSIYFDISTIETDRPGPSYTSVTLVDLQKKLEKNARLFLILGWDSFNELPKWHDPGAVVRICTLVAITRKSNLMPDLDNLEKSIPGIKKKTMFLDITPIEISSTEVRERVAKGLPLNEFVPESVERYIKEKNLYRLRTAD
jgi:nicotinate-nucleotide adenylyltransferase